MGFCRHRRCGYSHLAPLQKTLTSPRGASADALAPRAPAERFPTAYRGMGACPLAPRTPTESLRQGIELRVPTYSHLAPLQKVPAEVSRNYRQCAEVRVPVHSYLASLKKISDGVSSCGCLPTRSPHPYPQLPPSQKVAALPGWVVWPRYPNAPPERALRFRSRRSVPSRENVPAPTPASLPRRSRPPCRNERGRAQAKGRGESSSSLSAYPR